LLFLAHKIPCHRHYNFTDT